MAEETTGVPMSSEYCGYQTATPPPYYTTKSTYAASTYYTEAPKNYTTELSAPAYYYYKTEAPVYYAKATEYYTTTKFYLPPVNCGVVLLLVGVSLMVGSTTGVPMSRGYGGYQTATRPSYCTTKTNATTGYYTAKAQDSKKGLCPEYYTAKSAEYYTAKSAEYYTAKSAEYYTAKSAEYYTAKSAEYYTAKSAEYYTAKSAEYYTAKSAEYYTAKSAEYYTAKSADNSYYVEPEY
ncbi:hypothetical protein DAPPUDRAFT_255722 [Daphnia pulex]|uniref:Uncharacterized protein n=1 Tax=Daphnia pulex TaxID=6669 RepID=E9H9L2_DAPPU|nr:hypothetical protein DAPPUDRAFT_255722 [Daphnia pulex]|eukprot:EFX71527.1 hypothetical protein DAPPUDRAFT_255722 [Daphnia pulex]